jgi:hypothetical protein
VPVLNFDKQILSEDKKRGQKTRHRTGAMPKNKVLCYT